MAPVIRPVYRIQSEMRWGGEKGGGGVWRRVGVRWGEEKDEGGGEVGWGRRVGTKTEDVIQDYSLLRYHKYLFELIINILALPISKQSPIVAISLCLSHIPYIAPPLFKLNRYQRHGDQTACKTFKKWDNLPA